MSPSNDQHGASTIHWILVAASALIGLAVIAVAVWSLVRGADGGDPAEDDAAFTFTVGRVTGTGVDSGGDEESLRRSAEELRPTLDAMYTAGFVDPDKWEAGRFPEVLKAFSGEAASRAREDLNALTLGPAAERLRSVDVERGRLNVRFLLGQDERPFAAVAATTFQATGTLEEGRTVSVEHSGRYLMRPGDDGWTIIGYRVDGELAPGAQGSPGQPTGDPGPGQGENA